MSILLDAKKWLQRRFDVSGKSRVGAAGEGADGVEMEPGRVAADRNLSSSFTEHHLDRHELVELFPLSYINENQPTASQGAFIYI